MSVDSRTRPYYCRYDDHYTTLYGKGIRYWSDGPERSLAKVRMKVETRILEADPDPRGLHLVEMGCGEGFLIGLFADLGMHYVGIDCSPHAIAKAGERAQDAGVKADLRVMDLLKMKGDVSQRPFDIVFDMACFHMLVVDGDRTAYLSRVKSLMGPRSHFVLMNQARDEKATREAIHSVGEYESMFDVDLSGCRHWEAWDGEGWVDVELPRFACRPRSKQDYREELERAGFRIRRVHEVGRRRSSLDFVLTLS